MSSKQNIAWGQFGRISTNAELETYLAGREYGHGDYCHYTRLSIINSILEKKRFWMGCVSGFNDNLDSDQFGEEKKLYYSLCFSTGTNENLALWYLYSGMNGHGGRLRFTKSTIRDLINTASFSLWECTREGQQLKPVKEICTLERGTDIQLSFKDIIYSKTTGSENSVDLKYNTMTNHIMTRDEFDQYKANNIGFNKGLIWYYEKETRLLAKIIGKTADIVQNSSGEYVVMLTFDEKMYKKIKLDFAPEVNDISEVIGDYKEIQNYIYATSHAKLSAYKGTLKMDLCKKCDKAQHT